MATNHMGSIINFYQAIKGLKVDAHLLHSFQKNKKELSLIQCVDEFNIKKIQGGEFKLRKEINFNNKEVTTVIIDGYRFDGLKSWDKVAFNRLTDAITEYCTGADLTGHKIQTLQNIEEYCKGSKTSTTARHINKDGTKSHEYCKDSYKWGKIDWVEKFYDYIETDKIINTLSCDKTGAISRHENNVHDFLIEGIKKSMGCNPRPNGWNATTLENYYITYKIIPSFIKNYLKIDLQKSELENLQRLYFDDFSTERFIIGLDKVIKNNARV